MKSLKYLIILLCLSPKAFAFDPTPYLQMEIGAMKSIEPFLEIEDLNRLELYERYTMMVVGSLKTYGVGHVQTFEAFQDQIVGMEAGALYFQAIGRESWGRTAVKVITDVQDLLVKTYGFDRNAYDHTLMRILTQIDHQCSNLKKYNAPESILNRLNVTSIDRAMAIVKASIGSRPKAFAAAHTIAKEIKAIETELTELNGASRDLYNTALTLRFFNERLIDYAQYDDL